LMVGIQQGSQILDVFTSSERTAGEMFKQIGTSIGSFLLNPLTLAVTGVLALAGAVAYLATQWSKTQKEMERGLIGVGRDTSIANLNRFQAANAGGSAGF